MPVQKVAFARLREDCQMSCVHLEAPNFRLRIIVFIGIPFACPWVRIIARKRRLGSSNLCHWVQAVKYRGFERIRQVAATEHGQAGQLLLDTPDPNRLGPVKTQRRFLLEVKWDVFIRPVPHVGNRSEMGSEPVVQCVRNGKACLRAPQRPRGTPHHKIRFDCNGESFGIHLHNACLGPVCQDDWALGHDGVRPIDIFPRRDHNNCSAATK
mmetsp:Transcript_56288/g.163203  ORF Transcript_56288/g.163203 Transcript_56288/m.163203 type:complete len:211 (-) Transcript_56288:568-1200(-)